MTTTQKDGIYPAFGEFNADDQAQVTEFFGKIEGSGESSDMAVSEMLYNDELMFCSPDGARTVKKGDLLGAVPKLTAVYRKAGLVSNRVLSVETRRLDGRYLLAHVRFQMRFEREGQPPATEDIAATYVLSSGADGLQIVLQLDHQNLIERLAERGILKASF